jgi:hypothetical protein
MAGFFDDQRGYRRDDEKRAVVLLVFTSGPASLVRSAQP